MSHSLWSASPQQQAGPSVTVASWTRPPAHSQDERPPSSPATVCTPPESEHYITWTCTVSTVYEHEDTHINTALSILSVNSVAVFINNMKSWNEKVNSKSTQSPRTCSLPNGKNAGRGLLQGCGCRKIKQVQIVLISNLALVRSYGKFYSIQFRTDLLVDIIHISFEDGTSITEKIFI